ncbi:hypothetical protein PPL_08569 [Heterostelium album PN500]|uniref:TH1 domain-containing protein n=1 Tax=Heterostelium pallidum (strain ATCC 26659 / Pp 5 / PN500) TaxID=670386 RepID=D3BJ45_HETP5|nr:hypothetical protein PPL_08569 [Heterostelium album PN500]EFA77925.1 hypothetical protein PPL_08569 [Heterostelium album PN500]|eukprot:XP_020430053.1 hypothetical protein PPL_08569 [Heterostelium album PN500]
MTFGTNNSPVGSSNSTAAGSSVGSNNGGGGGVVGSVGSSSGGSGSLSPSSSITNFNILSMHEWNSPTSSLQQQQQQNQRGSANGSSSLFGSLNTTPNYDVELIVQTTKQEDARFMGKKKRRCSSVSKVFLGDFLQLSSNITILKMISKFGDNHILFSDVLIKVNKRNKMQERIIIITDRALYNVQPVDYKLKRRISMISLTSLSMSTLEDNFIVIHVNSEYDYVLISGRKIEIATVLVEAYYKQSIFNQMFPPQMLTLTTMSNTIGSPRDISTGANALGGAPLITMSHSPGALIPSPILVSNNNSSNNNSNNSNTGVIIGSHQNENSLGGRNSNNGSRGGGNNNNINIPSSTNQGILSSLSTSLSTTSNNLINSISSSFQQPNINVGNNNNVNNQSNNTAINNSSNNNNNIVNNNNNVNNSSINNNNSNNSTPSTTSPISQAFNQSSSDHLLPVNFTERIEYKIEGDSMREIIFTRVQGAVNIQIQTLKSSRQATKKDHTRLSAKYLDRFINMINEREKIRNKCFDGRKYTLLIHPGKKKYIFPFKFLTSQHLKG